MNYERIVEIEGLDVVIEYAVIEGNKGDYWTPPTPDDVRIKSWRLLNGEKSERATHSDYDDEEWEQWMDDIDTYVWTELELNLLENL